MSSAVRPNPSATRRPIVSADSVAAARAVAVEEPGDQVLAGAGLALDQDCGQSPRGLLPAQEAPDRLAGGLDRGTLAEQLGRRIHRQLRLLSPLRWSSCCSASYHSLVSKAFPSVQPLVLMEFPPGISLAPSRGMRLVLHMIVAAVLFVAAVILAGCDAARVAQW